MSRDENDSFFKEVDEGVRQDRFAAMARKWGPYLGAALVAALIGVGAAEFWRGHTEQQGREQAVAFSAAQQQARNGDLAAATTQFETLSHAGPETFRVLSMMEHAAGLQTQGDMQGALAGFDAAAAAAHDPLLRDTAKMRAAYIVADTQDFQAVQARLKPLIDGGGQISYLAKELLAVEAWEAGQNDLARTTLEGLQLAFEAPESVRQRAQLALAVLPPAPASAATPAAGPPAANAAAPPHGETK